MKTLANLCLLFVNLHLLVNALAVEKTNEKLREFNPFVTIQAETFNASSGVQIEPCLDEYGGQQVDSINDGDWMVFLGMDFQDGAYRINLRVATSSDFSNLGYINLRLDSVTAYPFATIITRSTPDYTWTTLSQYIEEVPVGVHDLFITFTSDDSTADIVQFNWFQFNKN